MAASGRVGRDRWAAHAMVVVVVVTAAGEALHLSRPESRGSAWLAHMACLSSGTMPTTRASTQPQQRRFRTTAPLLSQPSVHHHDRRVLVAVSKHRRRATRSPRCRHADDCHRRTGRQAALPPVPHSTLLSPDFRAQRMRAHALLPRRSSFFGSLATLARPRC